jgi:hypothetical protein
MTGRRRGYMIVELLLVLTALVIVFGLCVGLIHSLLRLDRAGRDHLAEATTRGRLARQFRQDVRAASRSSLSEGPAPPLGRLELEAPDGRVVVYEPGDGRLLRIERAGDRQVRREEYRFPSRAAAQFRSRREDGASFVILTLRRKGGATSGPQRESDYEALLGRDARLARRQGGGS